MPENRELVLLALDARAALIVGETEWCGRLSLTCFV